ncbi:MAG: hypothetical protein CMO47_04735 [Verrucomicrobiales bacterium]|nr:hypothetical protein [Verrucomicrobiales bacterium]
MKAQMTQNVGNGFFTVSSRQFRNLLSFLAILVTQVVSRYGWFPENKIRQPGLQFSFGSWQK